MHGLDQTNSKHLLTLLASIQRPLDSLDPLVYLASHPLGFELGIT